MDYGPVPVVIQSMKDRINYLIDLWNKYPHIEMQCDKDGEDFFFTQDVNSKITHFEKVDVMGFNLFITSAKYHRIYADPPTINVFTDAGNEIDWLPEIVKDEYNPKVLVALMRKIKSQYLSDSYYHKKYPFLKLWFKKYK